jgi:uncharacterized membrane protein
MISESKKRSVVKTISWRLIATLNSFIILLLFPAYTAIILAVIMNLTGFVVFYMFERLWAKIQWGRIYKS